MSFAHFLALEIFTSLCEVCLRHLLQNLLRSNLSLFSVGFLLVT